MRLYIEDRFALTRPEMLIAIQLITAAHVPASSRSERDSTIEPDAEDEHMPFERRYPCWVNDPESRTTSPSLRKMERESVRTDR